MYSVTIPNPDGIRPVTVKLTETRYLNPSASDRQIHDILCDASDIYHHKEDYVDDPSTITYEPEAEYFARWMEEH